MKHTSADALPARRVAVACSGGRDSVALLHATAKVAKELKVEVWALHVNHGLMPLADAWQQALRRRCRQWRAAGLPVHFDCVRLPGGPAHGQSIEAWARRGRYLALAEMSRRAGIDLVLLAQHRRDQAETVLLQALRGAGAAGMAAMPLQAERAGVIWARPWLDQPRRAIESYLRRHRLRWVDDESNEDRRYARALLRRELWPVLERSFPQAETSLAHAAARAVQEREVLDEVAQSDLANLLGRQDEAALPIGDWLKLSPARRALVLRLWLNKALPDGATDALVNRLGIELPGRFVGRWPIDGERECVLYRGLLRVRCDVGLPLQPDKELQFDLSQPGCIEVTDWRGYFTVTAVRQGGVPAALLKNAVLRPRRGGESFQSGASRPARSLKKQFQDAAVSPERRRGPLVYLAGALTFVPGLGLDSRAVFDRGVDLRLLEWTSDQA